MTTQCLKIGNKTFPQPGTLRHTYGGDINLKLWMEDPNNVYIGRKGRIFIDGTRFGYEGSKWANPFPVGKKYTREESLKKYMIYLIQSGLTKQIGELKGKCLGCFCKQSDIGCHAQILCELANES